MQDLVAQAVQEARKRGADYADARFEDIEREELAVRNDRVEKAVHKVSRGIGIRVLLRDGWGYAASQMRPGLDLDALAGQAMDIARASSMVKKGTVRLAAKESHRGAFRTRFATDPFAVPLEKKMELLLSTVEAMRVIEDIRSAVCHFSTKRTRKVFASTEGSLIEQEILMTGAGLEATAVRGGGMQRRSYPNSLGGDLGTGGYELVEAAELQRHARETALEARELISAATIPSAPRTVIIDGSQLALQVHESCGHPTELDRVLGEEVSLAGASFLTLEKLGSFRYGSTLVNIVADATAEGSPGGCGTFGYDDEGVPARRVELVREGRFVGYLSSRETAAAVGLPSSGGAMRADSWAHVPIIRMTNVSILPGEGLLKDLVADTEDGVLLSTNKSWSIDDRRLNFQFGIEAGWEIRRGKKGRLLRNLVYQGMTPQFWGSMNAICGMEEWKLWGVGSCGKGDPVQIMQVGHGAAPARFGSVVVGSSDG